jgi:transcriptional regulator with XRE-family HTH domain
MSDQHHPRAKTLGNLIREAREYSGRSVIDSAQALGITPEQLEMAEAGEHTISLPDLEVLALYLKVPMGYFWGSEALVESPHVDYSRMIAIRHRMIGVRLHQFRIQAKRSPQEVAAELGVDVGRIEAYEAGEQPVPYPHLEQISKYLDVSIDDFMDSDRGPLGRHEAEQRLLKHFGQLPPEMQAFIANPRNTNYLETAQKLSEMEVEKLRQVAESILEITW